MQEIVVVLDNVRSNHNVGSMFRTADAAGCARIYLCGITPAPVTKFRRPNAALLKVALDADQFVPWEVVGSTVELLQRLRADGYVVWAVEQGAGARSVASAADAARDANQQNQKIALVMGNEISGVAPEVLACADQLIEIPMYGKKESLNVAVAFGIVVFGLRSALIDARRMQD